MAYFDQLRLHAAAEGRWRDAQQHLDDLKTASLTEGERLLKDIRSEPRTQQAMAELRQQLGSELTTFSQLWERRIAEFDSKASDALKQHKSRSAADLEAQEDVMRQELSRRRPHFSKYVMRAREALESLVNLQQYGEADVLQRALNAQEAKEQATFSDTLSSQLAHQTKLLHEAAAKTLAALQQRIRASRDQLLSQRKIDFMALLQKHDIRRTETVQREERAQKRTLRRLKQRIDRAAASAGTKQQRLLADDDVLVA